MPIEIRMPALSPTMTEGNLTRWLKKEGDEVHAGDVIAEIETDKATMEYEAADEGRIGKIIVPEGAQGIKVHEPIALLLEEGEDPAALEKFATAAPSGNGQRAEPAAAPPTGVTPKTEPAPSPLREWRPHRRQCRFSRRRRCWRWRATRPTAKSRTARCGESSPAGSASQSRPSRISICRSIARSTSC